MEPLDCQEPSEELVSRNALVVSKLRFLCDSVAEVVARLPWVQNCTTACSIAETMARASEGEPVIILFDVSFPGGVATAAQLCAALPAADVIALGVFESEETVLAWADAGARGYVPNTASIADLGAMILAVSRGEQTCSPRIAGSLWRRLAAGHGALRPAATPLTHREREVVRLVVAGCSNKIIARRLNISVGTTKTHVHNVLDKLGIQRRSDVSRGPDILAQLQERPGVSAFPLSPR
jgi:two-component system, NarL family, nitrate/nitrite response regulator NarL